MKTETLFNKINKFAARPDIFFFTLIWLMILVVVGTISQRYIGLYQSQMKYFSSLIFWVGYIPLPGAALTLVVTFVGLVTKLLFHSRWDKKTLGINVTHFGAVLLLFGGFLTGVFSEEGGMRIEEGAQSNVISSYHDLEFVVRDTSPADHDTVTAFPQSALKPGKILKSESFPFEIQVINRYQNCTPARRQSESTTGFQGFLKNFDLMPAATDSEDSNNRPCLIFKVSQAGANVDGTYGVFMYMSVDQTITVGHKVYVFEIQNKQTVLPFSIALIDFERKAHPGTNVPSHFKSEVYLIEGETRQKIVIQMNQPFRHKDYTFYQASFMEGSEHDTTVLAVVKNAGRLFPYISSLIMCLGLLLHLSLQVPDLIRKRG